MLRYLHRSDVLLGRIQIPVSCWDKEIENDFSVYINVYAVIEVISGLLSGILNNQAAFNCIIWYW